MKTRLQSIVSVYPESKALSSGSWGFLGSPSLSQVESGRSASRGTGRGGGRRKCLEWRGREETRMLGRNAHIQMTGKAWMKQGQGGHGEGPVG